MQADLSLSCPLDYELSTHGHEHSLCMLSTGFLEMQHTCPS